MADNNSTLYIPNFEGTNNNLADNTEIYSWNSNSSPIINNDIYLSLDDKNIQELIKKIFLNNFDFSYLEEIFKNCTEEELKLMHANYEYIIKLVEQHYFEKV